MASLSNFLSRVSLQHFRYFGNGPADLHEFYLHAALVVEPPERAEEEEEPSPSSAK
jgi:hypothetical protein